MQPEGVVDVDAIPSPINEPMIPTIVEEQDPTPTTEQMKIDPRNMEEEKQSTKKPSVETVQPTDEVD
jgi:hypothetical protein